MRYFRAATKTLFDSLLSKTRGRRADHIANSTLASPIVQAIHQREEQGLQTRLVQLHEITDLTQPEALNALARLEQLGSVKIEPDHANTFQSSVTLSDDARWRLQRFPGSATG
jgi:DNA-binding MarR family transcriptional regulator